MNKTARAVFVLTIVVAIAFGSLAWAGKGGGKPGPSKCPNSTILCPDVWDPVVCDDGQTYSNQCYADRACATGCESTGGGPVEL